MFKRTLCLEGQSGVPIRAYSLIPSLENPQPPGLDGSASSSCPVLLWGVEGGELGLRLQTQRPQELALMRGARRETAGAKQAAKRSFWQQICAVCHRSRDVETGT